MVAVSELKDGEWLLVLPDNRRAHIQQADPLASPCTFLTEAPELSETELRTDDADLPRADGRAFGTDYTGGKSLTLTIAVVADTEGEARDALNDLAGVWRGDGLRSTPGQVASLYARRAGRTRVVYGRSRKFAVEEADLPDGVAVAVATFEMVDDLWYDAAETVVGIGLVPSSVGGIATPLRAPLSTTATSDRSTVLDVTGEVPTWPVVEFKGPITNPSLRLTGSWTLQLATTIAAGQTVRVDTRPWARTVLLGTAGRAGTLTRNSARPGTAVLRIGQTEAFLSGSDATGTSSVTVRWRNAHTGL